MAQRRNGSNGSSPGSSLERFNDLRKSLIIKKVSVRKAPTNEPEQKLMHLSGSLW